MTKKIISIVATVILVIGISAGTTMIVGKKGVPVSTKVENGLSAYELAKQYGYEGTVQEWLKTLEGKSAYQIAVDSGYKGTESEWLASLKATSDNTANIKDAKFNSKGELVLTLSDDTTINLGVAVGTNGKDGATGKNGADGKDGKDGKDGATGKDGVSISEASINDDGQLILTFTDGKSFNLDKVVGAKGEAGIGISTSKINEQGELILTYSNGQEANLGKVIGTDGKDGQDGATGKDGNAIVSTIINNSGELIITYSNGKTDNLGVVVGRDGQDGANGADGKDGQDGIAGQDGADGANGKDGKDGVGVASAQISSDGQLVLTYTNGQISNLGKVVGEAGKDGQNGTDGKDGVNGKDGVDGKDGISVVQSEINSKGELVITYSNNEVDNLGKVVGADGKDGINGKDGKDGVNGKDGVDGKNGENGVGIENIKIENDNLSITLTNGTTMNLGNIKGADGKNGTDGKDGANGADGKDGISVSGAEINNAKELVLTFSDGTDKNLGLIVGQAGSNGIDGKDGINGTDGRGIKKTEVNAIGELIITYTDDTSDNLGVIISDNGEAGTGASAPCIRINTSTNEWEISTDGGNTYVSTGVKATGAAGKDGADGKDGKDGVPGKDGKDGVNGVGVISAAINDKKELVLTFSDGTETNLGLVVGTDGKDGQNGVDGKDGEDGHDGADGKDGVDGVDGKDGVGISGASIDTSDHLILTLSNGDTIDVGVVVGADGKDGQDGVDGKDGKNGVGIKNVTVSEGGILTVTLDNDTIFTLGNIKGKDGVGIAKTEINDEGKLIITYTDNKVVTLDKVVGNNGIGIKSAEITEDYMLKLVFTDNGTQVLGPIRGEKGADGVGIKNVSVGNDGYLYVTYSNIDEAQKIAYIKGDKGDEGKTGKDGVGVVNSYVDENLHLWIVLSDGNKIDAGYVGVTVTPPALPTTYTVTFKDWNGTVLKTESVESGKNATAPENPKRDGYEFVGWSGSYTNVTSNVEIIATYVENNNPMLGVSNANATAGATKVTLTVSLKNNPGFLTMALKTTFNSDALTLTKVTTGIDFMDYSFTAPKNKISGCTAAWFASDLPEEIIDGDIMTLQFTVNANAIPGRYPVTISCPDDGSTVDGNKEAFYMSDAIGYITIE